MFCYSATSEDKLTPLQCKKFSCQSLTRVVASLEVHTTASTTAKLMLLCLGQLAGEYSYFLCNNLSLKCKQKSLSFAATISYIFSSYNCADECLHGISGGWVVVVHVSWLLHNNSIECCCLLLV